MVRGLKANVSQETNAVNSSPSSLQEVCFNLSQLNNLDPEQVSQLAPAWREAFTVPLSASVTVQAWTDPMSRKLELDEALLEMLVVDAQPLSIVENVGFKAFVNLLDPTYVRPGRKTLKAMLQRKYEVTKEKAMAELGKASTVSLTADMWTSINMDAYLAETCHYVTEEVKLSTVLLGGRKFPDTHTAANIAEAKSALMTDWGITGKVQGDGVLQCKLVSACSGETHQGMCKHHSTTIITGVFRAGGQSLGPACQPHWHTTCF
ncbi:uncharacterized protein LOC114558197 [Perca flavescens]|uniref:uncharacterized protein LOC114558197 n=1 Tax=Perca flavescens TaxID=8167 RepID=UPI00106DDE55|nr:uncharacterized protein LOC114558197 [Perca flavescens]